MKGCDRVYFSSPPFIILCLSGFLLGLWWHSLFPILRLLVPPVSFSLLSLYPLDLLISHALSKRSEQPLCGSQSVIMCFILMFDYTLSHLWIREMKHLRLPLMTPWKIVYARWLPHVSDMYWVNICNLRWARFFPFSFFCSFLLREVTFLLGELAHLGWLGMISCTWSFFQREIGALGEVKCVYILYSKNIWAWASAWLHTKSMKGCNWMWTNTNAFMEEQSRLQEHSFS